MILDYSVDSNVFIKENIVFVHQGRMLYEFVDGELIRRFRFQKISARFIIKLATQPKW